MSVSNPENALFRFVGESTNPKETRLEVYVPPNEKIFSSPVTIVEFGPTQSFRYGEEASLLLENTQDSEKVKEKSVFEVGSRGFIYHLLNQDGVKRAVGDRNIIVSTTYQLSKESRKNIPDGGFGEAKSFPMYEYDVDHPSTGPWFRWASEETLACFNAGLDLNVAYTLTISQTFTCVGGVSGLEKSHNACYVGEDHMVNHFIKSLSEKGYSLTNTEDKDFIKSVIADHCYVATDIDEERKRLEKQGGVIASVELEDGSSLPLGSECFEAAEVLFHPERIGLDVPGVGELIKRMNFRNGVNIILVGSAATSLPGLKERILRELPDDLDAEVIGHGDEISIVAAAQTFTMSAAQEKEAQRIQRKLERERSQLEFRLAHAEYDDINDYYDDLRSYNNQ